MKIKMIDLFVKIANKEKLPKKIKYRDNIWEYTSTTMGIGYQYYSTFFEAWQTLQSQVCLEECLNDEVEIIEEPKKIEKISWNEKESLSGNLTAIKKQEILARRTEKLKTTLNQLIDEINNLKEK